MKKVALSFIFSIIISGIFFTQVGYAAEAIPSFDARIKVNESATIEVTEQIVYDFGTNERHGIFRKIPYSYQAGDKTYVADVSSVLVTDELGSPRPFQESRANGELELKIGDPDKTVTGVHTYVISYIVTGPFLYFDEYDELYWNVTGYWPQEIQHASVLVDLPRGASILNAACYQGEDGSKITCDKDERLVSAERAGYNAVAEGLSSQEGLTVAVAFPKGVITEIKNQWEEPEEIPLYAFWPFGIPVLVFAYMLYFWYTRGRDPKGRSTIVTEFSPPLGVGPAVAAAVESEWVKPKDIAAEIVRLATEGYIKIHRFEKKILLFSVGDYLLERIGEVVPKDPVSTLILKELFTSEFEDTVDILGEEKKGVVLSKMQNKFTEGKKNITERVYDEAVVQYFFNQRPDKVRTKYIIGGTFSVFAGFLLLSAFDSTVQGVFLGIAVALSGMLVMIFGNWMPAKTREGVRAREHLEGFKRYLKIAEKDRIKFHDSPLKTGNSERTIELFSRYLPYAMVFKVEEEWAEQFKDIFTEAPNWYGTTSGKAFSAGAFVADMGKLSSNISTAVAPKSSGSGGGGSSGGGFGGGGGGSW